MATTTVHRDQRKRELVQAISELAALEEHHAREQERFAHDYREKVKAVERAAGRLNQVTGSSLDYSIEDFDSIVKALKLDAQEWRTEAAKLSR